MAKLEPIIVAPPEPPGRLELGFAQIRRRGSMMEAGVGSISIHGVLYSLVRRGRWVTWGPIGSAGERAGCSAVGAHSRGRQCAVIARPSAFRRWIHSGK